MKQLMTIIFISAFVLPSFGQKELKEMNRAQVLITNKKYESAFNLLDSLDKKNTNPDIVLMKVDIVLNYFVSSMMHQMFALKDLEKNENIMDYRGKEGVFGMHAFEVDSILEGLIKTHPNNCGLYKGLGEYYHEVYLKYDGQWLKDDNELLSGMLSNFQKAIDGKCADQHSYYVMGFCNLSQKRYAESIPFFLKSIELKNDYATAHYNLAYAYLYIDDRENALKYAKNALELYTESGFKGDAARMIAQIYSELNDDKNALENYELSNKIDSGNYYTLKPLLNLYIKTGNSKTNETRNAFFNLGPTEPTIYNDLDEIYFNNNKVNELMAFYNEQLKHTKDNPKVEGNLNFYLAKLYIDTDKQLAKEHFLKAKEIFSTFLNKDHQVFDAITEGLELSKN